MGESISEMIQRVHRLCGRPNVKCPTGLHDGIRPITLAELDQFTTMVDRMREQGRTPMVASYRTREALIAFGFEADRAHQLQLEYLSRSQSATGSLLHN